MRGTFANIRLRNLLTPDAGGQRHRAPAQRGADEHLRRRRALRRGRDAAGRAGRQGVRLGQQSRDWAAKGPFLQGVRAVIAESYERIHRSNLVGMGILPLQYLPGESASSLGLTGRETFTIDGIAGGLRPRQELTRDRHATSRRASRQFRAVARLDGEIDVTYLAQGGVLQTVLRRLAAG